jgi:uncharacterized membrane protein
MTHQPPAEPDQSNGRDPFDAIVDSVGRAVPKNIWIALAAVVLLLLLGRVLGTPLTPAETLPGTEAPAAETMEGRVVELLSVPAPASEEEGLAAPLQRAVIELTTGSRAGERVEVDYGDRMLPTDATRLSVGDRVLVEFTTEPGMDERIFVSDFIRLPALLALIVVFALATVAVGQWTGLRALISVGISVLALGGLIVPGIMAGHNPLLVALIGSVLLMTASLYLIYQWRWKTHAALVGVITSLLLAAGLAVIAARLSHLTGLGSEDAMILLGSTGIQLDVRGLLLAGILIGAVGVLDDVTVSQASATFELKRANPALGWRALFRHGMVIGRDHIASMVNTLLLAYAGASLPLFLLLTTQDLSLSQTLNREFIAEEIVRTLVGSTGLILAVPITSLVASLAAQRFQSE